VTPPTWTSEAFTLAILDEAVVLALRQTAGTDEHQV
jgi:hypothetical protein